MRNKLLIVALLFLNAVVKSQSLSETQMRNARASGYAIVAARNPGLSFSILIIPWDGTNTLEYNANSQINTGWHAQAVVKGNFFHQNFDGTDFSNYSTIITSQTEFDLYKHVGTQWWIVCSTLPPFSSTINSNGTNIGIGTNTPLTKIHLIGDHFTTQFRLTLPANLNGANNGEINLQTWVSESGATWDGGGIGMNVNNMYNSSLGTSFPRINTQIGQSFIRFLPNNAAMEFNTTDNNGNTHRGAMFLKAGLLGIGTTNPTERLSVNGNIRAKKLIISQQNWSDYVFYKNYKLRPLNELEKYIQKYQHLPDVPSTKVVQSKGINVGDTQALLLKKIEELTLYIIELNSEVESIKLNLELLKQKKAN
jgi:hypothetical protein